MQYINQNFRRTCTVAFKHAFDETSSCIINKIALLRHVQINIIHTHNWQLHDTVISPF